MKRIFLLSLLVLVSWVVSVYHLSVFIPPASVKNLKLSAEEVAGKKGRFIDKREAGIHQLIVRGSPLERGLAAGWLTRELIYRQERELITQLRRVFPWESLRRVLEVAAFRWFWGLQDEFAPWMLEEIYGVSQSSSHEFDGLGDPFTRQVQYHGIHEVGQMMVDRRGEAMGCTVVALPKRKQGAPAWLIGRNFDFEGGRIFDHEKLMKWVFPDEGYSYVSVVWSGMVGAVTAVNEKGVYISMNAAGSADLARYGVPSTLVLTDTLMKAATAEEAVERIRASRIMITDIFVVADRNGSLLRVEKSPRFTEVIPLRGPAIVTNHLIGKRWEKDSINLFRREVLTSQARMERGQKLLGSWKDARAEGVLRLLRDKGEDSAGKPLHPGNRRAIDALIATHSVIFDGAENILYVSQGPGVSGAFLGFDLGASFLNQNPEFSGVLPKDPGISPELFEAVRASERNSFEARAEARRRHCGVAKERLDEAARQFKEAYWYYQAEGAYLRDCQPEDKAELRRAAWNRALELVPAYGYEVDALKKELLR